MIVSCRQQRDSAYVYMYPSRLLHNFEQIKLQINKKITNKPVDGGKQGNMTKIRANLRLNEQKRK